jgi:hypothetical protein
MDTFILSPSNLTFLWDECTFCFYMKVKHKITHKGPFPAIFGSMGDLTSGFYHNKPASVLSESLPTGVLKYREGWAKSSPISFDGISSQCMIRGRFDAVAAFEDGSYGVIDYKTSNATYEKAAFYSRQLSAYAWALEHPAPRALSLSPVTQLGLFIISPRRYEPVNEGEMAFISKTTWLDVPRDDEGFLNFLRKVMVVLDADEPPTPSETCPLCTYRQAMDNR